MPIIYTDEEKPHRKREEKMAKKDLTPKVPQMSAECEQLLAEARERRLAALAAEAQDAEIQPINIHEKTTQLMDQLADKLLGNNNKQ